MPVCSCMFLVYSCTSHEHLSLFLLVICNVVARSRGLLVFLPLSQVVVLALNH